MTAKVHPSEVKPFSPPCSSRNGLCSHSGSTALTILRYMLATYFNASQYGTQGFCIKVSLRIWFEIRDRCYRFLCTLIVLQAYHPHQHGEVCLQMFTGGCCQIQLRCSIAMCGLARCSEHPVVVPVLLFSLSDKRCFRVYN